MTVLAQPHRTTGDPRRTAASRDLPGWESRVRRILRPTTVELVDGSPEQRRRLVATGVRRGALRAPGYAPDGTDAAAVALEDLLVPEHRDRWDVDVAAGPGTPEPADEEQREAAALRAMTGAARGRSAWLVPFAVDGAGASGPELGVLLTDSLVAVLALQDEAQVGPPALARITAGEPWTALAHSVGLPLDDELGLPLRDDVPWPEGPTRMRVRLRGGSEVWSCGSPVAWT